MLPESLITHLSIIEELTNPLNNASSASKSSYKCYDAALKQKCLNLIDKYSLENFDQICGTLMLVKLLNSHLSETVDHFDQDHQDDTISVKNLSTLIKALDFLCSICIRPFRTVGNVYSNSSDLLSIKSDMVKFLSGFEMDFLRQFIPTLNHLVRSPLMHSHLIAKHLNLLIELCVTVKYDQDVQDQLKILLDHLRINVYKPYLFQSLLIALRHQNSMVGTEEKKFIAKMLSEELIDNPQCLMLFLKTCLDLGMNFQDWTSCQTLCKLILTPPSTYSNNIQLYYDKICQGITVAYKIVLFEKSDDNNIRDKYRNLFACLFRMMAEKIPTNFERFIVKELQYPILAGSFNMDTLPDEETLTRSIQMAHFVFCSGSVMISSSNYIDFISDCLNPFLDMYTDLAGSVSFCCKLLIDLITTLSTTCTKGYMTETLIDWIITEENVSEVQYTVADNGGICVKRKIPENEAKNDDEGQFLMEQFFDSMKKAETILLLFSQMDEEKRIQFKSTILSSLVVKLATLQPKVLENLKTTATISCNSVGLDCEKYFKLLQFVTRVFVADEDEGKNLDDLQQAEMAGPALQLCALLLNSFQTNCNDESSLQYPDHQEQETNFSSCLLLLSTAVSNENAITEADTSLVVKLRQGLLYINEKTQSDENRLISRHLLSIFSRLDSNILNTNEEKYVENRVESVKLARINFDQALLDLNDSLLPVKTHGLIVLSQLIKKRDRKTIENLEKLLPLLYECMQDEESYLYLPALNALSLAGEVYTEPVLNMLMEKFSIENKITVDLPEKSATNFLKIGEVVVKISKILGDLAPYYGTGILQNFLCLLKLVKDPDLKASCLSNIAEICPLVSYKLTDFLQELLMIIRQSLQCEKSPLLRRSSIHVIRELLSMKNASDLFEILGPDLRDLNRLITRIFETDEDDVVRLHAQLCIEELNAKMRKLLLYNENYDSSEFCCNRRIKM